MLSARAKKSEMCRSAKGLNKSLLEGRRCELPWVIGRRRFLNRLADRRVYPGLLQSRGGGGGMKDWGRVERRQGSKHYLSGCVCGVWWDANIFQPSTGSWAEWVGLSAL